MLLIVSPYILKKNNIRIGSIDYHFPLRICITDLDLDKTNFKLKIKSADVDLKLGPLLNGQFVGKQLLVSGVDIRVSLNGSPFSYSVIPYINFNQIELSSVSINILNSLDTINMNFAKLGISQLLWNDSILVQELVYENGLYQSIRHSHSLDTSIPKPIHVPDGVPKFNVAHLQLVNNTIDIRQIQNRTLVRNINLDLKGLNNMNGADLKLRHLGFIIQDSLSIEMNSDKLYVENLKGAGIHHLKLAGEGFDLNIQELSVKESSQGKRIQFVLDKSTISPRLIHFITKDKSPFKDDAPSFMAEAALVYVADSLLVKNLSLSVSDKTNINIHGSIVGPGKENQFHLQASSLCLNGDELKKLLKLELPSAIHDMQTCSDLSLVGNPSKLEVKGKIHYNNTLFDLVMSLSQSSTKHLLARISLSNRYFDLAKILPLSQQDLKIYNLNIQSSIDLSERNSLNQLTLHIQNDSIRSHSILLNKADFKTLVSKDLVQVILESEEHEWKVVLNGKADVLNKDNIVFWGEANLKNLEKINSRYKTGPMSTMFTGEFLNKGDRMTAMLKFNKLKITSESGMTNHFDQTMLSFKKNKNDYQFYVGSDSKPILEAEFTEDLLTWFSKPNLNPSNLPHFYLTSAFELDSSLTEQFFGKKIHLDLHHFEVRSDENGFSSLLEIPLASFGPIYLRNLYSSVKYSEGEKKLNWFVGQIRDPFLNIDSLGSQMHESSRDSLEYTLYGKFPTIAQVISFGGGIKLNPNQVKFSYDDRNVLQFGEQKWTNKKGNAIYLNTSNYEIIGDLNLSNDEQQINFNGNTETLSLNIENLKAGPLVDIFLKTVDLDGTVNFSSIYTIRSKSLDVKGKIQDVNLDSIALGYTEFEGNLSSNKSTFDLRSNSSAWSINLKAQHNEEETDLDLEIEKLDLVKLDSVFGLFSKDYSLSGNLHGKLKINSSKGLSTDGQITFDQVNFQSKKLGISALINQQSIYLINKEIAFKNFTIENQNSDKLFLKGGIKLSEMPLFDLDIYSQKFAVLNNQDPKADLKGKLEIESDLKIKGEFKNLTVMGKLNLLKGGNINYYHKGSVSLDGTNEVVTFVSFDEKEDHKIRSLKRIRQSPINWDVSMNLANTDIYILLSKSKQEFVKLNAGGDLQLKKGSTHLPAVFGEVISNQGKIYHDLPMVSNVNLDIRLAKANWRGDLTDPAITFKGVETFRVTPYEMSSEFSDKTNKVPVDVTVEINNKTIKNLELKFDINSDNAEIQKMLSSLPADTKESYAINMLVHGKVNNDAKTSADGMGGVVNKLNEISRRNLKNTDLSFHSENTGGQDENGKQNASKIGYNFSKELYNNKFKVSVGGNFDVGATTAASKSSPLGTIQLEYQLKEDPNITLQLKRENSYRGPIEGQVDESGVIINFNKKHKNIFMINKKQKTDTLAKKK